MRPTLKEIPYIKNTPKEIRKVGKGLSLISGENNRLPWRSWNEWNEVYVALTQAEAMDELEDAAKLMRLWIRLPGCPTAIEATKVVVDVLISRDTCENDSILADSYAQCICRFVTLFTDEQYVTSQGLYNDNCRPSQIDMTAKFGIPTEIVDMRNKIVHRRQPSIESMQLTISIILSYLMTNYWHEQHDRIISLLKPTNSQEEKVHQKLSSLVRRSLRLDLIEFFPKCSASNDLTKWIDLYQFEVYLAVPEFLSKMWQTSGLKIPCSFEAEVEIMLRNPDEWLRDLDLSELSKLKDELSEAYENEKAIFHNILAFLVTFPRSIHCVLIAIYRDSSKIQDVATLLGIDEEVVSFVLSFIEIIRKVMPYSLEYLSSNLSKPIESDISKAIRKSAQPNKLATDLLSSPKTESMKPTQIYSLLSMIFHSDRPGWKLNRSIFNSATERFPISTILTQYYSSFLSHFEQTVPFVFDNISNGQLSCLKLSDLYKCEYSSDIITELLHPSGPIDAEFDVYFSNWEHELGESLFYDFLLPFGPYLNLSQGDETACLYENYGITRLVRGLLKRRRLQSNCLYQITENLGSITTLPRLDKFAHWVKSIVSDDEAEALYSRLVKRHTSEELTTLSYQEALECSFDDEHQWTSSSTFLFRKSYRQWAVWVLTIDEADINAKFESTLMKLPSSTHPLAITYWKERLFAESLKQLPQYRSRPILLQNFENNSGRNGMTDHRKITIESEFNRHAVFLRKFLENENVKLKRTMNRHLASKWFKHEADRDMRLHPSKKQRVDYSWRDENVNCLLQQIMEIIVTYTNTNNQNEDDNVQSHNLENFVENVTSITDDLAWYLMLDDILAKDYPEVQLFRGRIIAETLDSILNQVITNGESTIWLQNDITGNVKLYKQSGTYALPEIEEV